MSDQPYTDTTGKLARESELTVVTIATYADLGLLDFIRCSNGTRLFRSGQAPRVREIYAERMANRRRRPVAESPEAA
jgi:DNA-binding transcriptional MerR regulator